MPTLRLLAIEGQEGYARGRTGDQPSSAGFPASGASELSQTVHNFREAQSTTPLADDTEVCNTQSSEASSDGCSSRVKPTWGSRPRMRAHGEKSLPSLLLVGGLDVRQHPVQLPARQQPAVGHDG